MDGTHTFGGWLAERRVAAGIPTQRELGRRLQPYGVEVSTNTLSKWETDRAKPSRAHLRAVMVVLGVTPAQQMDGYRLYAEPTTRGAA